MITSTVDTNICSARTALSEQCSTNASWNSIEGYAGTWNPSTVSTATVGTIDLYIYTNRSLCYGNNNGYYDRQQVTPTFTQLGPLCLNSAAPILPGTSNEGFAGTGIRQRSVHAAIGTTTYTFTPTDPCATVTTMDIVISSQVTPTFTQIGPLCLNSSAPTLPGTSNEGYAGTGTLQRSAHATVGTTTYTFTPTDPCATVTTMDIDVTAVR